MTPNYDAHRKYVYGGGGLLYEVHDPGYAFYYHFDAHGNTVAVTDDSANVMYRAEYSPYGEVAWSSCPRSAGLRPGRY